MSARNDLVLITGATGKQGHATARRLLAAGRPVRILVRDPESAVAQELAALGAEVAVGDFDAPETLGPAVAGAHAVFLVPPAVFGPAGWNVEVEAGRGEAVLAAARQAGVEQIVFTGVASFKKEKSWGAEGKRRIERALQASDLRWTVLRPVRFMENFLMQNAPVDGITDGVHRHLFPAGKAVQSIALDDIAAFAELAFADPDRFHGRTLELAGDELTAPAALALITEHTGYPVRYEEVPESEAVALGAQIARVWTLTRTEDEGWHADIPALREILPSLHTFEAWLTETGAAQLKSRLAG
ncbi:NmrA/HSCARG family protein [Nocardia sp. NPDC020380]|uniref:NmrA/HSCARG family protein n=1 Tax=Nocardia sp. NPDC020380 TaxID=3364309 RepID=UPI0037B40849